MSLLYNYFLHSIDLVLGLNMNSVIFIFYKQCNLLWQWMARLLLLMSFIIVICTIIIIIIIIISCFIPRCLAIKFMYERMALKWMLMSLWLLSYTSSSSSSSPALSPDVWPSSSCMSVWPWSECWCHCCYCHLHHHHHHHLLPYPQMSGHQVHVWAYGPEVSFTSSSSSSSPGAALKWMLMSLLLHIIIHHLLPYPQMSGHQVHVWAYGPEVGAGTPVQLPEGTAVCHHGPYQWGGWFICYPVAASFSADLVIGAFFLLFGAVFWKRHANATILVH